MDNNDKDKTKKIVKWPDDFRHMSLQSEEDVSRDEINSAIKDATENYGDTDILIIEIGSTLVIRLATDKIVVTKDWWLFGDPRKKPEGDKGNDKRTEWKTPQTGTA